MEYCLLEEETKEALFACWRSRLKMEYLFVGEADLRWNIYLLE